MKINPFLYGALTVVVFLGVIYAAQSTGYWSTERRFTVGGEKARADSTDVASIRGSMTLGEISKTYNVPVAEILAKFGLPADTSSSATLKGLREKNPNFEVSDLRDWLAGRIKEAK